MLIAVCDGLKGLPEAINTTWEQDSRPAMASSTRFRNSVRYTGRQHRDGIVKALKPAYTTPSEAAAKDRVPSSPPGWGERYPAIVQFWHASWAQYRAVPRIRRPRSAE